MSFEDLIWKIWEIEEEIRDKQQEQEDLKARLRSLKRGGSGRVTKTATSRAAATNGIETYTARFDIGWFEFEASDAQAKPRLSVRWQRDDKAGGLDSHPPSMEVTFEHARQGQKLKVACAQSSSDVMLNGRRLSFAELEDSPVAPLLHEYHLYLQDFIGSLVRDMQKNAAARAGGGDGGVDDDKKAVDVISDIACACSGFGLIGLAICGPTCLGMVIAKIADP